jgi:folate-binding protein YgfZ
MSRRWLRLPNQVCWRVSGRDARRYLHNRLSNDIKKLTPGAAIEAAALTAQGRVELLLTALAINEELFLLYCDGGASNDDQQSGGAERGALSQALARYVVADRVSFTECSDQLAVFHIASSRAEVDPVIASLGEHLVGVVERGRIADSGVDIILHVEQAESLHDELCARFGEPINRERFVFDRWEAGFAAFPEDVNDRVNPLECGLRRAVAFGKGCYVGQEVVERGDAIGRVPRRMVRLVLSGAEIPQPGAPLCGASGEQIGKLVRVFKGNEKLPWCGVALLKVDSYQIGQRLSCGELVAEVIGETS